MSDNFTGNRNSTQGVKNIKLIVNLLKKEKVFIAIVALLVFIISLVYSIFSSQPMYKTDFRININTASPVNTSFGPYRMPFTSIDEYIALINSNQTINIAALYTESEISSREISKSISTQLAKNFNSFSVTITSEDPDKSYEIANSLLKAYKANVELTLRKLAVNFFISEFESSKLNAEKSLLLLYSDYEKGINDISEANKYISETSEEKILDPFYEQLSIEVANIKMRVNSKESEVQSIKDNLSSLNNEKEAIGDSNITEEFVSTIPGAFSSFRSIVNIIEYPGKVGLKSSGNLIFDLSLGLVFGIMLGIILAFVKDYWKTYNF